MARCKHVLIVGAGIGGLAVGHYLKQAGNRITIIESSANVGGVACSESRDGFLLEYGPNSTVNRKILQDLVIDLEIAHKVIKPSSSAKKRFLTTRSDDGQLRLISFPRGPIQALKFPLLTFGEKLRALGELFVRAQFGSDLDVWTFCARRFGPAVATELVSTLLSGVWAADTRRLSARSALPNAWRMSHEFGSIILGGIIKALRRKQHVARGIVSFDEGMRVLPQALAARFSDEEIRLNCSALKINRDEILTVKTTDGEFQFDHIVIATAADVAANLVGEINPELAERITAVPYAPLGILHLAADKTTTKHPLDGFGFLSTPTSNLATRGVLFNSSLFSNRAPSGKHLLTAFVGGATHAQFADVLEPQNKARAIGEIRELCGLTEEPVTISAQYLPRAIPNYAVNHHQLVSAIHHFSFTEKKISFLGNWLSGISFVDRLEEARRLADRIVEN